MPAAKTPLQPATSPRRGYHHGGLREALIAAALDLIEHHGVRGFTLKDAAAAAGVSVAAPYRHFADKEALLATVQAEGFRRFDLALRDAFQRGKTPAARMEDLGLAYARFAWENPAYFRVMFGYAPLPGYPPNDPEEHAYGLLERAAAELAPRATAAHKRDIVKGAWSIAHGFAVLALEGAFGPPMPVTQRLAELRRVLRLFQQTVRD